MPFVGRFGSSGLRPKDVSCRTIEGDDFKGVLRLRSWAGSTASSSAAASGTFASSPPGTAALSATKTFAHGGSFFLTELAVAVLVEFLHDSLAIESATSGAASSRSAGTIAPLGTFSAGDRLRRLVLGDCGQNEDTIAPYNGRGQSRAGNRGLPFHVLILAPLDRRLGIGNHAILSRSPPIWPISGG